MSATRKEVGSDGAISDIIESELRLGTSAAKLE
jgi:hypothetical protein